MNDNVFEEHYVFGIVFRWQQNKSSHNSGRDFYNGKFPRKICFFIFNIITRNIIENSNAKKVFTCSFTILFHNHIYEVIPSNGSIYIGKLYNESFAESEIKGLSELLGMELAKEIEEIIESN